MAKCSELKIDFKHYFTYEELTDILKKMANRYPDLAKLVSIGKSPKGRDIWTMKITSYKTGTDKEKPGFYIDGNTHAAEVTGSMAAVYTIWHLLTKYGEDPYVTELLNTRSFYINPRVDPDGAELFLTTKYRRTHGGRFYPLSEDEWEREEGIYEEDMDKDGHILQMRIKDPNGDYKVCEKDSRLMLKRDPDENGGTYYRIYTEGKLLNWDGKEIKTAPRKYGLNLNRNFPAEFFPHPQVVGAGPYPLSEPETRAVADFMRLHPNIGGLLTYHTYGGLLPRLFDAHPDQYFIDQGWEKDYAFIKALDKLAERATGYPAVSSFKEFTRDQKKPRGGTTDCYAYLILGFMGYCFELWDAAGRAGLGKYRERGGINFQERSLKEEQGLKLLAWNDEALDGNGFSNWKAFNHPQLGPVEIGGWKKFTMRNPPPGKFLEEECKNAFMFSLKHASLLPSIQIAGVKVISISTGIFRIEVTIENQGFLPTNISQLAVKKGLAKPIVVEIEFNEGAELVTGRKWIKIDRLEGRSERLPEMIAQPSASDKTRKTVEWLLKAKNNSKIKIKAISEKAGTDKREINIEL